MGVNKMIYRYWFKIIKNNITIGLTQVITDNSVKATKKINEIYKDKYNGISLKLSGREGWSPVE